MNKPGSNQFKRAFRDAKESLTDAKKVDGLAFPDETPSTTIIKDTRGRTYIQILPSTRQEATDKAQLKAFPQYRLIDGAPDVFTNTTSSTGSTTTAAPDDGLIDSSLNADVTEFLRLLNDVGARISYFIDPANSSGFDPVTSTARNLVTNTLGMDSVTSNIVKGVDEMKSFFYEFGKKIAPPGINPYHNTEFPKASHDKKNDCCDQVNITCDARGKNIEYARAPYNPHDINTYMNCLDTLARTSTVREPDETYEDFNLKVYQSLLTKVKVTKFTDDNIDSLNVTRPLPYYNPMILMLEILKIDTKFFNILYMLNLHNTSRSPITNAFYGKPRTKINDNGFPVLSDEVTSTDIHNATVQMLELLGCILRLITFIDLDSYNTIIADSFSINAVGNPNILEAGPDTPIILNDQNPSQDNIPTFLYGHLISFCDATRQVINEIILTTFSNSPDYNPTKVANIAYNCTFGLLAIGQLIEGLIKSRLFATVMSMLFPSGVLHSSTRAADFGPIYNIQRDNKLDLQSITRMTIDGIPLDMSKVIPPKSIPNYLPSDEIYINKATFCAIITALCGISRFLWNSNAPCLRLCDIDDAGAFDPDLDYPAPSTTAAPPSSTTTSTTSTSSTTSTTSTTTTSAPNPYLRTIFNNIQNHEDATVDFEAFNRHVSQRVNFMNARYDGVGSNRDRVDSREMYDFDDIPEQNIAVRSGAKNVRGGNAKNTNRNVNSVKPSSRATPRILTQDVAPPTEEDGVPDPNDEFSTKDMIKYLQEYTYGSVVIKVDENVSKVLTFLQVYVSAFASHDRQLFNSRVSALQNTSRASTVNRNLYSMLTRGVKF